MSNCDQQNQESRALRCLIEISNEPQKTYRQFYPKQPPKRHRSLNKKSITKLIDFDSTFAKPQRLPFIPNKSTMDRPIDVHSSKKRMSQCIMFDKGLGHFNSVQIKRGKCKSRSKGKYLDSNNNFIKFYSETSQVEIELIKNWLNAKKESCKNFKEVNGKSKKAVHFNSHFSVKRVL